MSEPILTRYKHIFSRDDSRDLWDEINATKGKAGIALFTLGCYCQRLETVIHKLERRIAQLEDR